MNLIKKLCPIILLCFFLASCSETLPLEAYAKVINHSDCETEVAVIILSATGGEGPYVYQLRSAMDNKIIHTELSDEQNITVELPNMNSVHYKLEVIDDMMLSYKTNFEVRAEGRSIISDMLQLDENGQLYPMNNITVNLYQTELKAELYRTTLTDKNGMFNFQDIPSGIYYVSFEMLEKYDDYHLAVEHAYDHVKIATASNSTLPFEVNCRIDMNVDFVFRK